MPIGNYGLQSDEQIGQQKMAQGQAMERSGQAIGQAIGQAPAQAIQASGAVLQQQHLAQQMQDEHVQAQAMLQMHELQKQELVQKMQVAQQMQQIEAQRIANDSARLGLEKDQHAFMQQHLQRDDEARAASIYNAMGPRIVNGKVRQSRYNVMTHDVEFQDYSMQDYEQLQQASRARQSPEEEAAHARFLNEQANLFAAKATEENVFSSKLNAGSQGAAGADKTTTTPPPSYSFPFGQIRNVGNSNAIKESGLQGEFAKGYELALTELAKATATGNMSEADARAKAVADINSMSPEDIAILAFYHTKVPQKDWMQVANRISKDRQDYRWGR